MRRIIFWIIPLLLAACSGAKENDVPQKDVLVWADGSVPAPVFSSGGGHVVCSFTASSAWTAALVDEKSGSWCKVTPAEGEPGARSLFIMASENSDPDERIAIVKMTCGKTHVSITVTQKQKDALILTPSKRVFEAEGGTLTIEIRANTEVTYSLDEGGKEWIIPQESKGLSASTLTFLVMENEDVNNRRGYITVKGATKEETVEIFQKGIIPSLVLSGNEIEVAVEGGEVTVDVTSNVDIAVEIPADCDWMESVGTKAMTTHTWHLLVSANESLDERSAEVRFVNKDNELSEIVVIHQLSLREAYQAREKAFLEKFYREMDGDNWTNNENWCSDKPVNEWFGVHTNGKGLVEGLNLPWNNLTGILPSEITELTQLTRLHLSANHISGSIPETLGNLTQLFGLDLSVNQLSGQIPESLSQQDERFGDTFYYYFYSNQLSGPIPAFFKQRKNWPTYEWEHLIPFNLFSLKDDADIPAESFSYTDMDGHLLESDQIYSQNKLTALVDWNSKYPYGRSFVYSLLPLYNKYHSKGFEIIGRARGDIPGGAFWENEESVRDCVTELGIPWRNVWIEGEYAWVSTKMPAISLVDEKGFYRFNSTIGNDKEDIPKFLEDWFGSGETEQYASTDYSQDGKVTLLQAATEGKGIDLVFMGDGFSDRLIASGRYDAVMRKMMEYFFDIEPYKSFRHLFNVYAITAVSRNEEFFDGASTALEGYVEEKANANEVHGSYEKTMAYAGLALDEDRLDLANIIVALNQPGMNGTCYFNNASFPNDYGAGWSRSYFTLGDMADGLRALVIHEAGGHGVAKLDDEYDWMIETAPDESLLSTLRTRFGWGWYRNIDVTNDPEQIKWARFLSDGRYTQDDAGIYEGGSRFRYGVYRASERSIMYGNQYGEFNAPSREAIYYTIHKLAFGDDWEYKWEDFVAYDAINRKPSSPAVSAKSRRSITPEVLFQTAPPVYMGED